MAWSFFTITYSMGDKEMNIYDKCSCKDNTWLWQFLKFVSDDEVEAFVGPLDLQAKEVIATAINNESDPSRYILHYNSSLRMVNSSLAIHNLLFLSFRYGIISPRGRTVIQNAFTERSRLPNKNYGTLRIPSL